MTVQALARVLYTEVIRRDSAKNLSLFRSFAGVAGGFLPHRDQLLGCGRMQRHRGVEIGLGGAHFHRDGGDLDHFRGPFTDNMTANHAIGLAVDHELEQNGRVAA